jgi:hypothetical protein
VLAFRVLTVSLDLHRQASVGAMDDQSSDLNQHRQLQISFPFDPPVREIDEKDQAIAGARVVLKQSAERDLVVPVALPLRSTPAHQ